MTSEPLLTSVKLSSRMNLRSGVMSSCRIRSEKESEGVTEIRKIEIKKGKRKKRGGRKSYLFAFDPRVSGKGIRK